MSKTVLVINAGSSSIKFQLLNNDNYAVIASGICERIFIDGKFVIKFKQQKTELDIPMANHEQAINYMIKYFIEHGIIHDITDILGVGHRVVHGSKHINKAEIINADIITKIADASKLAPLHNQPELDVIKIAMQAFKNAVHVVVVDTAFHTTIPEHNSRYAVPKEWETKYDVKRYGAHGTSYQYVTLEMQKILNKPQPNLIVCHLGNGASICAIKNGQSYNTSMGLTPLEGLIMGTRSGDIDPAVVSYVANQAKIDHNAVTEALNKQSGMKALTNGLTDFRDVMVNLTKPEIKLAFQIYTQRISSYIVRYLNDLQNHCDAIVFTAGIGENIAVLRQAVIEQIYLKKITIDQTLNTTHYDEYAKISTPQSEIAVYVMHTNEELMIAREVKRLGKF